MTGDGAPSRVPILADDLIWSTRLASLVTAAGAEPVACASVAAFAAALGGDGCLPVGADGVPAGAAHAMVDLGLRIGDALAAVRLAASGDRSVLCVAQHDDVEGRHAALEAGARRVLPYRRLAADGPRLIGEWLADSAEVPA